MRAFPVLPFYRAASAAFAPFSPFVLYCRRRWRSDDIDRDGERMGRPSQPRPDGPLAWLHGASVGESLALLPLVERLSARGLNVLVSTGTSAAAAVISPRLPPGALHQFLPLDVPQFLARFLDYWRPNLALVAESVIWPNLFLAVERRDVPLLLVNARMSPAAFDRWRWFGGFIEALLQTVDLVLAQTDIDAERFARLGARHVKIAGNLKYDVNAPPADRDSLALLAVRIGARPVWVAASTHRGEEEIIVAAHQALATVMPRLLTIIVPRHAKRGAEIAAQARGRGLAVLQRSAESNDAPMPELYVADTTGELGLFYRLSGIVFLGKSLVPTRGGGQNPIEAAKLGCAILHGPHVENFDDVYRALDDTRSAVTVADADTMARVVAVLLSDSSKLRHMARAASKTVTDLGGACDRIMSAIEPHIAQLAVENRHATH
jgi:3-deoxy-D-manno-octulosonic-acid transferase